MVEQQEMVRAGGATEGSGGTIREVLESYLFCLDVKDFDALVPLFTDDAALAYDVKPHTFVGGRDLAAWIRAAHEVHDCLTFHVLGNLHISRSDQAVSVSSHVVATLATPVANGFDVTVRGIRYDDTLVETPDGWKISSRTHMPMWQYQSTGVPLSDIGAAPASAR